MLSCMTLSLSFQGIEHLKPHIVHSLANAELYCLALSHLYADPNYHNLNHWGVIQVLARKGIFVAEPADCSLTETVLIQTTPLKMVSMRILDVCTQMSEFCDIQQIPLSVCQSLFEWDMNSIISAV